MRLHCFIKIELLESVNVGYGKGGFEVGLDRRFKGIEPLYSYEKLLFLLQILLL